MFKLLKYEIKESSKYFIYSIIGNVIASIILALVIGQFTKVDPSTSQITFASLMFLSAFGLFVAAYVGFIFMMITSYRKDLYSDSAYLKFSLPVTGWKFLNAKILLLMFWGFIMASVTVIVNTVVYSLVFDFAFSDVFNIFSIVDLSPSVIIVLTLLTILSFVEGIILLYTCITFVKSYFYGSKKGYIWFLFFILFNFVWSMVKIFIDKLIPYYIVFTDKVTIVKNVYDNFADNLLLENGSLFQHNIASLVVYFLLMIGLYIFTAYMLDKKVDI